MEKTVQIQKYQAMRMTDFSNLRAVIHLFDDNAAIGRLEFLASGVPQKLHMGKGYPTLHYPIGAFPAVIDLLRNEEPAYLVYSESMGYGRVVTGAEPVGEGELATT